MKNYYHPFLLLSLSFAALCFMTPRAVAALTFEPEMLFFEDQGESITLQFFEGNTPVPAPVVKDWKLYTNSSSYRHMIQVEKKEEHLLITTTSTAEDGSYLLVLESDAGSFRSHVRITLSPTALDLLPPPVVLKSVENHSLIFELDPFYLKGSRLNIAMGTAPGNSAAWWVNGVLSSTTSRLLVTLDKPGPLHIVYEEHKGVELTERVEALSEVLPRSDDTIPFQTKVHTKNSFQAPQGYDRHEWFIDDQLVSELSRLEYTFLKEGHYRVRVEASHPADSSLPSPRKVIYDVQVTR
ncbi:MAG: hypothetical protein GX130_08825 [Candidatus Hydrogenedens sp.]|jgi:hypothetical protein|nr:hypothetical protein [Candidatus Hydrogenedens sp.]